MNRIAGYGRLFWIAMVVAGASLAIAKGTSLFHQAASVADRAEPSGCRAVSSEGFAYRPIEQIRLGDRVPGENPVEAPDTRFGTEVDQATWRQIDLRCLKRDGSDADVSLLRPLWWLEHQEARVGGQLQISVPECGIDGNAWVLAIGECPSIEAGAGNVVTGTFRHRNAKVIDLYVEGLDKPIGTTPNHKFWSEDRNSFVRADTLPGHHSERSVKHDVFNIETYPQHVYHITTQNLLVHNAEPITGTTVYHGTTTIETVTTIGVNRATAEAINPGFVDPEGFSLTSDKALAQKYANFRATMYGGNPVVIETSVERLIARGVKLRSGPGITDAGEVKIPWKQAPKVQPGDFARSCP